MTVKQILDSIISLKEFNILIQLGNSNMRKKIVLLTGTELRHDFFRQFIASDNEIEVITSYCESKKNNLNSVVALEEENSTRTKHLKVRDVVEKDFFEAFCDSVKDESSPVFIEKGEINNEENVNRIILLEPDLIIAYGCSIIDSKLLEVFKGKFINIHLGLSPYYRGSGTNFWPFVNKELQFIGTTFMHIDSGIDTGEIVHQIRADINYQDNIHQIGNRLIRDSFITCKKIIKNFDVLDKIEPLVFDKGSARYYRNRDFTEKALRLAYENIEQGLIEDYLNNENNLSEKYPIIENSFMGVK